MGPFHPMSLSSAETSALHDVAKAILEANLDRYLDFTDVDPKEWRLVKSKDQMRVYSSQKERRGRLQFQSGDADGPELQTLLFVGARPGTLNDMMHSVVDVTIATAKYQDLAHDDLNGTVVLSPLQEPTEADPLTSVAVKWMELNVRRRSMGLVKNRDYVYIETTGVKCLPSGERLGYHVMHSVDIPQAEALQGRFRAKLSVCSFFRQVSETSVSIYSMAMLDPMTDYVRRVVTPRFSKMLLSTFTHSQTGRIKRLRQALGKRCLELTSPQSPSPDENCNTCNKRVSRLGKLMGRHGSCMLCCGYVCSACKIEKILSFEGADQKDSKKKVAFCFSCLTDVMTANEAEFCFEDEPTGDPEITQRAHVSVWTSRLPSWSLARRHDASSIDFASTR